MWRKKGSVRDQRRREQRRSVDWVGRYRLEGAATGAWASCNVVDVSTAGAGLVLFRGAAVRPGQRLLLELESAGQPETAGIRVHGKVRNVDEWTSSATVRVGVEFTHASELEMTVLTEMLRRREGGL